MTTDRQQDGYTEPDGAARENAAELSAQGELTDEEILERTVLYAFDQGAEILEQTGELEPFTILIDGEELYIEEHPGQTEKESYA
ncbi:MAG: hypothetical protein LBH64_01885, partial [Coriobacteriales bacterium]|nr:hypothetical protein [Coriobacteriales bacterium]